MTGALLWLMAQISAIIQPAPRDLLEYTQPQTDEIKWAKRPSLEEIKAQPASAIPGGARAALMCSADKRGYLLDCQVEGADPDRAEVIGSALKLTNSYLLNDADAQHVKWSKAPVTVWVQVFFPDKNGMVPNSCNPAFGCIQEPPPPPPPPPPKP